MTQVSPSILSADFAILGQQCQAVLDAGAGMLHFDVMDGHFVPNLSFGVPVLQSLHKALPDAFFDVHLMITHPLSYVEAFAKAGAGCITFHVECDSDVQETIDAIHKAGCKAGLSIKPGTPVEAVLPYLDQLELVLVMSVEPGFGGQSFMPMALDKLRTLDAICKEQNRNIWLEVDGGIDATTGALCTQAGANLLVAGSAIFGKPDLAQAVQQLRQL